jgi:hypothetical protein
MPLIHAPNTPLSDYASDTTDPSSPIRTQNTPATPTPPSFTPNQDPPRYWGHLLALDKPTDCMRLLLQNPHGLDAKTHYRKLDLIARSMAAYQFDVICLPETNCDWKKHSVLKECHSLLRKHLRHHRLITSCGPAKARHAFLPGGTATIVANNWTGRISDSGSDPHGLGRWTYVRTKGRTAARLLIITVYQVCKQTIKTAGCSTAFSQQWHALRADGKLKPDPRKQFSIDLSLFLDNHKQDHVIIAGDINSWLRDPTDDKRFGELVLRHRLQDVLLNSHGSDSEIPTRKEGRRIDYLLASSAVASAVVRCGALHFDHVVDSDHRGLFLDLNIDTLLGGRPPTLSSAALRGIDSTNPKQCKHYLDCLTTFFKNHRIVERCTKLQRWTKRHGLTPRLKQRWEKLDLDITRGCLHAERSAGRKERPAWSEELHHAHLSVVYLKIAIRALHRNRDFTAAVAPFLGSSDSFTPPSFTDLPSACTALQAATATLKEIRANAKAYREAFLEEKAQAAVAAMDVTAEQAINILLQREGTKKAYATLRRYLRPGEFSPVTEVHVEKPDGSIEVVNDPEEMYQRIIDRDIKHYNQAEGTPCTVAPVKAWLGLAGTTNRCQSWLDGSSTPTVEGALPESQLMFDLFKCETPPPLVDANVTSSDYRSFFGKWAEKTSTSQDRHLGHWKALISHTAATHFPDDTEHIINVLVAQMNISVKYGYAWRRWLRIVSAKIPKRAGNMLLNKLRTIHLIEPDCNWLQGLVIGRRMIKSAETNNTLHDNQWGCRPGRHAIGAVMLKVMSYEIARVTRTPLGSFDMDAASCFDRIIIALAMLLCRRQGVPSGTCIMAATVLLYAQFYIKTTHGISEDWYSSTFDFPTHGPGQGSRIGPALWVLVSCLMFAAMDEVCRGAEFCDPTGAFSHQRTGDGFVDDVANVFNFGLEAMLTEDFSPQQIAEGMQDEAQVWERLLWTTGGALELSKCFYYLIAWDFHKSGAPALLTPAEMPDTEIFITNGADAAHTLIQQTDSSIAHRTLGVWPAPSGCNEEQSRRCMDRSNQIAEGVRHSHMARNEALMGYRHIWLPSVGYALAAWPLTERQLHRISINSNNAFISKMGFCCKTSRKVIFGSRAHGGFGLTPLLDFQGVNQATLLVQHLRLMDSVGKMLLIGYAWTQLFSGVSFQLLSKPDIILHHIPLGWYQHLRYFLSRSETTIDVLDSQLRLPQLLRHRDQNIMDAFLTLNKAPEKLRNLNYCRLYLRAETLAELCNADGTRILPSAWRGTKLPSTSTLLWPRQGRPSCWTAWRQALAELFLLDTTAAHRPVSTLYLRNRLGRWKPSFQRDRNWPAYQDHGHLFVQNRNHYLAHKDLMTGRLPSRDFDEQPCGRHKNPASLDDIVPADSSAPRRGRIQVLSPVGYFRTSLRDLSPDPPRTIQAHLSRLEPWEASLFPYLLALSAPDALKKHLEQLGPSSLFLCHDGGATDQASFGWCIASKDEIFWEGSGSGAGRDPGSFRAEGYGMLAALRFLVHYRLFWNILTVPPTLKTIDYTDSQSLLGRLSSSLERFYPSPGACLASEYDLEAAISSSIVDLDQRILQRHVKGHQDDDDDIETVDLPWPAQLNVVCDHLASNHLRTSTLNTIVPHNPHCNAYVRIRGESVTGQIRKALFDAAGRPRLRQYLIEKHHWSNATFDTVNWAATRGAITGLTIPEHRFVVKLSFHQLPVGFRLRQRESHIPANCPSCDNPVEDDWHWITCQHRAEWRETQHTLLSNRLSALHTHPGLQLLLLRAFADVLTTGDCDFFGAQLDPDESRLIESQTSIGWPHLLCGRFSVEWAMIQDQYIDDNEIDRKHFSGLAWTIKVTQHIWRALHSLWKLRNTALHGTTFTESEATRRTRIEPLVRRIYSQIFRLSPADQVMLRKPLAERLQQPLSLIETWLSLVQPAFDAAALSDADSVEMDESDDYDDLDLINPG